MLCCKRPVLNLEPTSRAHLAEVSRSLRIQFPLLLESLFILFQEAFLQRSPPPGPCFSLLNRLLSPLSHQTVTYIAGTRPQGDNVLVTSDSAMTGLAQSRPPQMFVGFIVSQIHQREAGQEWRTRPAGRDACLFSAATCTPQPAHSHCSLARAPHHWSELPVPWP